MSTQANGNRKSYFNVYDIMLTGLMAAMVFVTTTMLYIQIPSPTGPVMLKVGNIFCLLAGMTLGPLRGGLAAGIGSMMFDLLNPLYISSAPFTLVRFFLMGFICGLIAFEFGHRAKILKWNICGALAGAVASLIFYIVQSTIGLVLAGSTLPAAMVANSTKYITAGFNCILAVTLSVLLVPIFRMALSKSGLYGKLTA